MRRALPAIVLLVVAASSYAADNDTALTLTLDRTAVIVDGVTRKGDVVIWGISRIPKQYYAGVLKTTTRSLRDDDGDGRVTLTLDFELPRQSQWIAIDVASARIVLGSSEGFALDAKPLGSDRLKSATNGKLRRLQLAMSDVEVLWVRPGVGAWRAMTFDGARNDDDGRRDGQFTLALDALRPVGEAPPPPDGFDKDDILVVGDTNRVSMLILGGKTK